MKRSAAISFLGMREARKVDSFSLKLRKRPLSSPLVSPKEELGIALTLLPLPLPLHSLFLALLAAVLGLLIMRERNAVVKCRDEGGVQGKAVSFVNVGLCMLFVRGWFGNFTDGGGGGV
jgi:hypothetical protein